MLPSGRILIPVPKSENTAKYWNIASLVKCKDIDTAIKSLTLLYIKSQSLNGTIKTGVVERHDCPNQLARHVEPEKIIGRAWWNKDLAAASGTEGQTAERQITHFAAITLK